MSKKDAKIYFPSYWEKDKDQAYLTQQTFLTYFFKLYIHTHMHMCTHTNAISVFINLESFCLYKQLEIWKLHTTHQPSLVELM